MDLPASDQWQSLYHTAAKMRDIVPRDMIDALAFTVIERAGNDEPLYANFYATGPELDRFGLNIYVGLNGLHKYFRILQAGDENTEQALVANQTSLNCYFGDMSELSAGDISAMQEASYTPDSDDSAICFRSYRPGYVPWYVEKDEADLLLLAMEQLIPALEEMAENNWTLDLENGQCLTRAYDCKTGLYHTALGFMPDVAFERDLLVLEDDLFVARLKKLPLSITTLEGDFIYILTPVSTYNGERLLFPCLCLFADHDLGTIADQRVLEEHDDVGESFLDLLIEYMQEHGRPRRILVREGAVFDWLEDLCKRCGITLEARQHLDIIDDFIDMISNGPPLPDLTD